MFNLLIGMMLLAQVLFYLFVCLFVFVYYSHFFFLNLVQLTFTIDRSVFQEKDIPDWYIIDFGLEVVDPNLKTQPSDEIELQPVNASLYLFYLLNEKKRKKGVLISLTLPTLIIVIHTIENGASVGLTVRELLENDEGSIEIGLNFEPK